MLSQSLEAIGDLRRALQNTRECMKLEKQYQREKQQKEIADLQARFDVEQAEREREIYRLRSEQLELENSNKTAELTSLSMRLVERKRLLSDIIVAIEEVSTDRSEAQSLQKILDKIQQNVTADNDWQVFEQQFEQIHQHFMQRLSQSYPSLTVAELRVCAFIRLGLSSSEIADLLHVTKRNVDTHRYRLRKKLHLSPRANLATFLAGIE